MANFSLNVVNGSEFGTRCNASATLVKDLPNLIISFNIKEKSPGSKVWNITIASGTFNTCKVQRGIFAEFLGNFFKDLMKEYSNFKMECPYKKGFYYLNNASMSDLDMLPRYLASPLERSLSLKFAVRLPKLKFPASLGSCEFFSTKDIY